ncbi:hypothetical protein C0991_003481 [Blastosporella zonata]|nr:hypothetical protein C0991_003481 [Blastosporella zonata]
MRTSLTKPSKQAIEAADSKLPVTKTSSLVRLNTSAVKTEQPSSNYLLASPVLSKHAHSPISILPGMKSTTVLMRNFLCCQQNAHVSHTIHGKIIPSVHTAALTDDVSDDDFFEPGDSDSLEDSGAAKLDNGSPKGPNRASSPASDDNMHSAASNAAPLKARYHSASTSDIVVINNPLEKADAVLKDPPICRSCG